MNRNFKPDFSAAAARLKGVARRTPLERHAGLSAKYDCNLLLKREDMQITRSFKLRGAYNMIAGLPPETLRRGVVCASAGNHAQGVAYACHTLAIKGVIFMPVITPGQKCAQVRRFGGQYIETILTGDTFDDCLAEARRFAAARDLVFIPPFDHCRIIEGQGTVGMEIMEDCPQAEVIVMPLGGGGLAAGTGAYARSFKPGIMLVGAEPEGAASMAAAVRQGCAVTLGAIDRFVDGAAVKRVGELNFALNRRLLDKMVSVPEGRICTAILDLYTDDGIVAEPAGALAVAALDMIKEDIKGKTVVCIISGGNNDISRLPEIRERSLLYEGLKHYFIIQFPQRPGALKQFVNEALGPADDITRFEFIKKNEKESGPALVGVELGDAADYLGLLQRLRDQKFDYTELNRDQNLFEWIL